MSDEQKSEQPAVVAVTGHSAREAYFKKSKHDLSGLPSALKAEMSRLVNRGPTPEMVERVKRHWGK